MTNLDQRIEATASQILTFLVTDPDVYPGVAQYDFLEALSIRLARHLENNRPSNFALKGLLEAARHWMADCEICGDWGDLGEQHCSRQGHMEARAAIAAANALAEPERSDGTLPHSDGGLIDKP